MNGPCSRRMPTAVIYCRAVTIVFLLRLVKAGSQDLNQIDEALNARVELFQLLTDVRE